MAYYNSKLDESSFSKTIESEAGRLTVGIYSYNQGPKKIQITRENRDSEGDFRFAKLGRLSKEEVEAIIPMLKEALEKM